jgi:hypothetical protein
MIRTTILAAMFALFLGGCQDRHSPVVRQATVAPESEPSPPRSPPSGFPAHAPAEQAAVPSGPEVDLGGVRLMSPPGWIRKPPRVEFIRAEFSLPRAEGDAADGRLTVSVAGGSVKDNVDRWRQQFTGKPAKESQEQLKADAVEVTLVDFSGTYNDQRGPFAPATECPDYRMLGGIFDSGGQLYFIKAYGPAKTMAAEAAKFRTFVQSLKQIKPK